MNTVAALGPLGLYGARGISGYFQLFLPQSMHLEVTVDHTVIFTRHFTVTVFP